VKVDSPCIWDVGDSLIMFGSVVASCLGVAIAEKGLFRLITLGEPCTCWGLTMAVLWVAPLTGRG